MTMGGILFYYPHDIVFFILLIYPFLGMTIRIHILATYFIYLFILIWRMILKIFDCSQFQLKLRTYLIDKSYINHKVTNVPLTILKFLKCSRLVHLFINLYFKNSKINFLCYLLFIKFLMKFV